MTSLSFHRTRAAACVSLLLAGTVAANALGRPAVPEDGTDPGFLRVAEDPGRTITLEIATKEFAHPEADRPRVGLVSVAHIADRSFYSKVQKLLEAYDVVLFEAVRPAGAGTAPGATPEERVDATRESLNLAASVIEAYRRTRDRTPLDLDVVRAFSGGIHPLMANWFSAALTDAWGNELRYETDELGSTYRLRSFGADGRPGGEGADADLEVSPEDDIEPLNVGQDGLQEQLAAALGLEFQLTSLRYDAPNWRSSDMDMPALAEAFQERGLDFAPLGDTLAGTSLSAQLTKFLLGALRMFDAMAGGAISDTMKVLLIEILSDESLVEASMGQMGAGFEEVIVDLRNQVVIDDLASVIESEPEVRSVAILYGAAHMPDFAERLRDQLGYEASDEATWVPAITVDLEASSVDSAQLNQMRLMVRRMLRQQFGR